ncbi:hypothetical protein FRC09_005479 [Ceratobasidium sp. 395]|nr:hypothetical protein FRC09_005479 [Ceratobasidium sp. 395]
MASTVQPTRRPQRTNSLISTFAAFGFMLSPVQDPPPPQETPRPARSVPVREVPRPQGPRTRAATIPLTGTTNCVVCLEDGAARTLPASAPTVFLSTFARPSMGPAWLRFVVLRQTALPNSATMKCAPSRDGTGRSLIG